MTTTGRGGRSSTGSSIVYVDEAAVALEAYRAGDLDIVQLQSDQIPEVNADPELSPAFVTYPQAATQFLAMNLTQEPFKDKKVREAFAYAIDRETLCAELRSGDCLPTVSFMPAGLPGAIETDQYAFDPEAAKQALAESSYGGPDKLPEIKLYFNSDYEERGQQSEWIAGEIRDILGVELTIEPMEGAALTALRKDPKTHPQLLYFGSWYQDYPDPQNWLSVVLDLRLQSEHRRLLQRGVRQADQAAATRRSIRRNASPSTSKRARCWSTTCRRPSCSTPPASSWSIRPSPATPRPRARSSGRAASHR